MNPPLVKPLISLRNINKRFGRKKVIEALDLEVRPGEFISLFGPNGAGKTTLLRILSGQLKPENGVVESDSGILSRAGTGFISHQGMLYPDLTGYENLEFFARLHNLSSPAESARQMIRKTGLENDAQRRARDYSRGMLQRLSLGRALINDPSLLLLDEPFTGLDRQGSDFLVEILQQGRKAGKTIIMATHNLRLGFELADRAMVMNRGRIALDVSTGGIEYVNFTVLYGEITGK